MLYRHGDCAVPDRAIRNSISDGELAGISVFCSGTAIVVLPIVYLLRLVNENERAHTETELASGSPAFSNIPDYSDPAYDEFWQPKKEKAAIPVECGPGVKGSVVKAKGFTFYRARIEPKDDEQFPDLKARVHSIKRDGIEMPLDEVLQIKYHPGDGSAPCARKDDPAFLDVVLVRPDNSADLHVLFWPAGMTNWNFEPSHIYQLDVAVLSKEASGRCEFEFAWTGDVDTSSCRLLSDVGRQSVGRQRSPEVTAVINESVRLLRQDPRVNNFPLRALQMAGVGDLQTEDDFAEVRESIIQHGFTDPIVGLDSLSGYRNTRWLAVIKWANRNQIALVNWSDLTNCIENYSKQPS